MRETTWTRLTAPTPGAIAILQLTGDAQAAIAALTGRDDWPIGVVHVCDLPGLDEVVAVAISADVAQIMPHGGPAVLQRMADRFAQLGIDEQADLDPVATYPEAEDAIEAQVLAAVAVAASPLAIDLLFCQVDRLRGAPDPVDDGGRSGRLDYLISPPRIVLAGLPNSGKSTLMNALSGEATSIVHPLPGATRDAVACRVEFHGLVADVFDLPGLRASDDPIEQEAIALAAPLQEAADLVVAIADNEQDWPDLDRIDLRVATKADLGGRDDGDLCVCALDGSGIADLAAAIRDALVFPKDLDSDAPWYFATYRPMELKPQST